MNKKKNRRIAVLFVVVAALVLLFGGLALGKVEPDGGLNRSQ